MSIENRNCSCGSSTTSNTDCDTFNQTREELANRIRSLDFAITELGLFLDINPENTRALCLHRKYANEVHALKDQYQRIYGPLTINFPCNKWRWVEEPWPWERGNF
jgi:spore coat protein JB